MRTTNNYDLKVIEGTDIFNPLATEPDNLDTIDTVLYENAVASVGTATELTSGNVHALTRVNADCATFRFVATANSTAGDTYTVDGVQVTALKPDGTPLATGDYVINANVLCILEGSLLTFYVGGKGATTAEDSERLGGELPEYYGKASDVQTALEASAGAQSLANTANENALNAIGAVAGKAGFLRQYKAQAFNTASAQGSTYTVTEPSYLLCSCGQGSYSMRIAQSSDTYEVSVKDGSTTIFPVMANSTVTLIYKGSSNFYVYVHAM